jgi:hypothetical protein
MTKCRKSCSLAWSERGACKADVSQRSNAVKAKCHLKQATSKRHSFECIGNHLCSSLHVTPIADFNARKYEEAKGLKGLTSEVNGNVAINHQREDSGSSAMRFPFFREKKENIAPGATILRNFQAVKKGDYFFS